MPIDTTQGDEARAAGFDSVEASAPTGFAGAFFFGVSLFNFRIIDLSALRESFAAFFASLYALRAFLNSAFAARASAAASSACDRAAEVSQSL